ncbi:MAG: hypothetical protein GXY41_09705 [Phycisphaerae bacterium]|nr:hypothetical protein [Phycisphaerae bacterium]
MKQTATQTTASALAAINNLVSDAAALLDQLTHVSEAYAGALVDLYAGVNRLEADLHKALIRLADGRDIDGENTRIRFHDGRLYYWPEPKAILSR